MSECNIENNVIVEYSNLPDGTVISKYYDLRSGNKVEITQAQYDDFVATTATCEELCVEPPECFVAGETCYEDSGECKKAIRILEKASDGTNTLSFIDSITAAEVPAASVFDCDAVQEFDTYFCAPEEIVDPGCTLDPFPVGCIDFNGVDQSFISTGDTGVMSIGGVNVGTWEIQSGPGIFGNPNGASGSQHQGVGNVWLVRSRQSTDPLRFIMNFDTVNTTFCPPESASFILRDLDGDLSGQYFSDRVDVITDATVDSFTPSGFFPAGSYIIGATSIHSDLPGNPTFPSAGDATNEGEVTVALSGPMTNLTLEFNDLLEIISCSTHNTGIREFCIG